LSCDWLIEDSLPFHLGPAPPQQPDRSGTLQGCSTGGRCGPARWSGPGLATPGRGV